MSVLVTGSAVDRIRSEAGFAPRYSLDRAFEDYTMWLRSHPGFG